MRLVLGVVLAAVGAASFLLSGCSACSLKQDPDRLREKTAAATADLKQDAKAMAQGVREGWTRDHPLDLNTATNKQLQSLPGISAGQANRIIAGRPYDSPKDLVRKHILSPEEFDRVAERVTAKH